MGYVTTQMDRGVWCQAWLIEFDGKNGLSLPMGVLSPHLYCAPLKNKCNMKKVNLKNREKGKCQLE